VRRIRAVPVVLAVWVAAPVGATPPGAEARRIPARLIVHRLVVVPVTVNGAGPFPFLLDTGATSSMVTDDLARELGLQLGGQAVQETATGSAAASLVRATLALGTAHRDGDVIRAPLDEIRRLDPSVRGLVGQDVLRLGNWWLDYRGASLVEDLGGALAGADLGERLFVHWHGDRPAIDASAGRGRALRLVLDSAASAAVLFGDAHASPPAGEARLTSLQDRVTVPVASVGPLRAGRAAIPRFDAAVVAGSAVRDEDGLIPTALFEGVYFDNREGAVVLNPRRSTLAAVR
jgi:hypothetical protein